MRLIHEPHNNTRLVLILRRQLAPQSRKIRRRRPARSTNDFTIPPRVIMNIDNTMGTRLQARLHQCVILCQVRLIEGTAEDVVDQVLPADGKAEDVEPVVFGKVRHLPGTVVAAILLKGRIDRGDGAGALVEGISTARLGGVK